MKFTFKNYIKKNIIKNVKFNCLFLIFCLFGFWYEKDIKFIILFIISVIISIYSVLFKMHKLNNIDNKEQLEKILSNSLLNIEDVYFTDDYIFLLDTLEKIYYKDIEILVPSFGLPNRREKVQGVALFIKLYLKHGETKKFTLDGDKDQDFLKFGEIVLEKNPNVFIGTLKEYEKNISEKKCVKND